MYINIHFKTDKMEVIINENLLKIEMNDTGNLLKRVWANLSELPADQLKQAYNYLGAVIEAKEKGAPLPKM